MGEPAQGFPFLPVGNAHRALEPLHLLLAHQSGVVVFVAGQRKAESLDGVGDEAVGPVVPDAREGLQHRFHVVAGEVGHQVAKGRVVVAVQKRLQAAGAFQVFFQVLPPGGAAGEGQRRIELVRAIVNPLPEGPSGRPFERFQ